MAVRQRREKVRPKKTSKVSLGTVSLTPRAKRLLKQVIDTQWIGQGELIPKLEGELADWHGVKHAVATANGTLACAISLGALKAIDGGGHDEVIIPALTFIAQPNSAYHNQLKPVFVDVGYDYQIDVDKIEKKITKKTLAIMPAHLLGRPAKMDKILELARAYKLYVVEDGCEALGSRFKGKLVGTFGDFGCFSFFVSHNVTTGEGGVALTNQKRLAERARELRNHGRFSNKPTEKYLFRTISFNAKMNQLEAAVGLGVMAELDKILERRRKNMLYLNKVLGDHFVEQNSDEHIIPHAYPIMLPSKKKRDQVLTILDKKGIEARSTFSSIPTQTPAYAYLGHRLGEFPVAEDIANRGLYVPVHQNLGREELDFMIDVLKPLL